MIGSPAAAQEGSVWDSLTVSVAGFAPNIDSTVRLDTPALQPGTRLDLESDLHLSDSQTVYQVMASVRLTPTVSVDASYVQINRSGTAILEQPARFGDAMFPVSTGTRTAFDTTIITASVGYALWQSPRAELKATFGAYFLSLNASIESGTGGVTQSADASAPLPLVGGKLAFRLTPNITFLANAEYLSGEIQDFDGSIANYRAALRFAFIKNLAIGLGYDAFDLRLNSTQKDFPGRLTYRYAGPKAFFTLKF